MVGQLESTAAQARPGLTWRTGCLQRSCKLIVTPPLLLLQLLCSQSNSYCCYQHQALSLLIQTVHARVAAVNASSNIILSDACITKSPHTALCRKTLRTRSAEPAVQQCHHHQSAYQHQQAHHHHYNPHPASQGTCSPWMLQHGNTTPASPQHPNQT